MSVSAWGRGRSRVGKLHVGRADEEVAKGLKSLTPLCGRGERVISVGTARQVGARGLCETCAKLAGVES